MTKYQKIFYDIKTTRDYKTVGDDVDYKVIVDDENREVILQFEESDSRADWKNNLRFIPWIINLGGHKVITTHGYAKAYESTDYEHIRDFISAIIEHKGYREVIRGWSFGSAMAKLTVRHLYYIRGKGVDEEDTYGDVKCFLNPFTYMHADKCAGIRNEFVCINDFVTWCVPFYSRTAKKRVGGKFSLKRILHTEYEHTHYEEFDYSEYE